MGTPVVASRCGGIPEQVIDGQTGLLFEPGNAGELAACLSRLLEDEKLRRSMGQASQRCFREHFGMRETYQRMAACFTEDIKPAAPLPVAS